MGFLRRLKNKLREMALEALEEEMPEELKGSVIRLYSGCEDSQTSADVANVSNYNLPDPAGRAGGACTSIMLNVLYKDEQKIEEDLSFSEVLTQMRDLLGERGFSQIPQLSSSQPIDINSKFDLVPDDSTGTRRAVMIGINYVGQNPGELAGCHNDVNNMKNYIMNVHGFEEDNMIILMDDGEHDEPTKENILNAYQKIIQDSSEGDAIYLHYSGHGVKLRDDDGDEEDGYDEALAPVDYQQSGLIRDDELYDILVKGLPSGVSMVALMDCCHSGTIMDLPYMFQPGDEEMRVA